MWNKVKEREGEKESEKREKVIRKTWSGISNIKIGTFTIVKQNSKTTTT